MAVLFHKAFDTPPENVSNYLAFTHAQLWMAAMRMTQVPELKYHCVRNDIHNSPGSLLHSLFGEEGQKDMKLESSF